MSKLLSEALKIDTALADQQIPAAATDSDFFRMDLYRKALFAVSVGAMATGDTIAIAVREAEDAAGTNAQALDIGTIAVPNPIADTITANTDVAEATLTAAACAPVDTCVVNGLTFTGAAAADLPNRVFLANAGDNNATAASLAAAINHATAGVPGVLATANAAVVTLTATEPGDIAITVVGTAVRLVAATVKAVAYLEVDGAYMTEDYTHLAVRVTPTAATNGSVKLLRGEARYSPTQYVAASDVTS